MGATASEMATDVAKSVFSKKTLVLGASTALVGSVGMEMKNRFIAAEPNEWLLLIKDGELVKKGVGILLISISSHFSPIIHPISNANGTYTAV